MSWERHIVCTGRVIYTKNTPNHLLSHRLHFWRHNSKPTFTIRDMCPAQPTIVFSHSNAIPAFCWGTTYSWPISEIVVTVICEFQLLPNFNYYVFVWNPSGIWTDLPGTGTGGRFFSRKILRFKCRTSNRTSKLISNFFRGSLQIFKKMCQK